jgi:hypothetical protein
MRGSPATSPTQKARTSCPCRVKPIVEEQIPPVAASSKQQHLGEADGRQRRADAVFSMLRPLAEFFHDADGTAYARTRRGRGRDKGDRAPVSHSRT